MTDKTEQSIEEINIVLFLDVGSVNTRAALFERVSGVYQFVGSVASRTVYSDNGCIEYASAVNAIRKLEDALDRHFLDDTDRLIVPQKLGVIGVDQLILTWTGGDEPNIVLMGLTESGSVSGLKDLLSKSGLLPKEVICAMQGISMTENIDRILAADPDIVLIAGGTEAGAERAVYRLGEILLLACKSISEGSRPRILYLGAPASKRQFDRVFSRLTEIGFGRNILLHNGASEDSPTNAFRRTLTDFACDRNEAVKRLMNDSAAVPMPGDFAYGRCIRLLSRMNRIEQTVLGIDVGAGRTITAFGRNMELDIDRCNIGVGRTLPGILNDYDAEEIVRSIGFKLKPEELRDYVYNKSCHPELIPANNYSAEIEQVLTAFIMKKALSQNVSRAALLDGSLGMVLLGGAVLRNVQDPGDALRAAMDGIRPYGVVDYHLDLNGLAPAIGAMASVNPELASNIATPTAFLGLGKVVRPLTRAKDGKRIFSVSLRDEAGNVRKHEIVQGGIVRIPLTFGRHYELDWYDVSNAVTIPGVRIGTPIEFRAGCMGLVFDLRGNDLTMPKEREAQIHLLDRWKKELGSWHAEERSE